MALMRMAVENYRCFKERQEIELRPITVILGKNNSGKSALTRLPLLLETGIRTDSTLPLDLDLLGDDPPDYLDLVYGQNPHRPLHLEFSVSAGHGLSRRIDVKVTIQNISEQQIQFVSDFEVRYGPKTEKYEWDQESVETGRIKYVHTLNGQIVARHDEQRFIGLLPMARKDSVSFSSKYFRQFFDQIYYLGPYRHRPARLSRLPSKMPGTVGASGEAAVGMLINDAVRGDGALLDQVNDFLMENLIGWAVEVHRQGPLFSIKLRSADDGDLSVNLLDAGTGVAQMLPLLVQRAQDTIAPPTRPTLQIIEEPELHLHPAAHALLADLFIAGIQGTNTVRFLIETHSETMLLRLRRRVAERKITPSQIAVYFVEHDGRSATARRIQIDDLGNLDYWPTGVFSEDFEETKKLAEAQFAQERNEG